MFYHEILDELEMVINTYGNAVKNEYKNDKRLLKEFVTECREWAQIEIKEKDADDINEFTRDAAEWTDEIITEITDLLNDRLNNDI